MGAAYLYAEDSAHFPKPSELKLLEYIDRFGVEAVTGRKTLGAGELLRMIAAQNIVQAYRDKQAHKDGWAAWQQQHPAQNQLLERARQAAEELDDDSDG
jgi:hypothetical protein